MANQKKTFMSVLLNGLIWENPTFVLMLGMCPTLAITTSGMNGIGMGLAVTAVLIFSNLFISLLRNIIPDSVRIPAYIIIIASFVTMIDMLLKAFLPDLSQALGMFIPLIVVNCIIFARAESFASKNPPVLSIADGLGMGLGFTFAITLLSVIRELLGNGTFFGLQVMPASYQPMGIMTQVPGGFITLGLLLILVNALSNKSKKKGAGSMSNIWANLLTILVGGLLVNNFVMNRFLGCCPFLGVSKQYDTAKGMSMAVIFVMTLASFITWFVQHLILVPLHLEYMQTIAFILVIAVLVGIVEMALKKISPSLYQSLGVYLPLITTNCAVLGVAILNVDNGYNLLESTFNGFCAAAGFGLAMILFSCIRERLALANMPKWMNGFPGALITAGLMAIAFMGFGGLIG